MWRINKLKEKIKTKKDRLFIIVMAIIIANLAYILFQIIPYLVAGGYTNIQIWALLLSNTVGIVGAFWLVRQERKRRRIEKERREQEAEDKFIEEIHN